MSANKWFRGVAVAAVMVMWPTLAAAQLSRRDVPSGQLPIVVGKTVWLTSADGRITKGKVLSQTAENIEVGEGDVGTTRLVITDVRRIQEPDSVANGVVKGALTLGLAGFLVGGVADASNAVGQVFVGGLVVLLGGPVEPIKSSNHYLTGALFGVATGALLGYALDSGKMKTLYERQDGGLSVAVRPIMSAAGNGVGVRLRW